MNISVTSVGRSLITRTWILFAPILMAHLLTETKIKSRVDVSTQLLRRYRSKNEHFLARVESRAHHVTVERKRQSMERKSPNRLATEVKSTNMYTSTGIWTQTTKNALDHHDFSLRLDWVSFFNSSPFLFCTLIFISSDLLISFSTQTKKKTC